MFKIIGRGFAWLKVAYCGGKQSFLVDIQVKFDHSKSDLY